MPDREKVIKGLECHVNLKCDDCPYVDAIHPAWGCHLEEQIADALSLLKEQEKRIEDLQDIIAILEGRRSGMADVEKLKGFELCADGKPCIGNKYVSCPFSPRNNAMLNCGVTMAKYAISLLKEQEAVEPKTGHWIESKCLDECFWVCSECNFPSEAIVAPKLYKYCPNCGTKMEEHEVKRNE